MPRPALITLVAGTILVVGAAVVLPQLDRAPCVGLSGIDQIEIPLSRIARDSASFFCYRDHAGDRIRFLLARDDAGKVMAALDACDQCFTYRKGYTVKDGYLVCGTCGNRYKLSELPVGKASCVPIKLRITQQRDKIQVKVAELDDSRGYFR